MNKSPDFIKNAFENGLIEPYEVALPNGGNSIQALVNGALSYPLSQTIYKLETYNKHLEFEEKVHYRVSEPNKLMKPVKGSSNKLFTIS